MGNFKCVLALTLQVFALVFADPCSVLNGDGRTCHAEGDVNDPSGYNCVCETPSPIPSLPIIRGLPDKFNIVGVQSNRCADVEGVSTNNLAITHLWDCLGRNQRNQVWSARPSGAGYNLLVEHSGKCLDVKGGNSASGTPVIQYDCNGGNNQVWTIQNNGKNTEIKSLGKCLDATGQGTGNGVKLILWDCNGGPNQHWNINAI